MRHQTTTSRIARTVRLDSKPLDEALFSDAPFALDGPFAPGAPSLTVSHIAEKTSSAYIGSYRDALETGVFINPKRHRLGEVDLEWHAVCAAKKWPVVEVFRTRMPGPCSIAIDFSTTGLSIPPRDFTLIQERISSLPRYDAQTGQRICQLLGGDEYEHLIIHRVPLNHLDGLIFYGLGPMVRRHLLPPFLRKDVR